VLARDALDNPQYGQDHAVIAWNSRPFQQSEVVEI